MGGERFDRIAEHLAAGATRRGAVRLLAGGALGALLGLPAVAPARADRRRPLAYRFVRAWGREGTGDGEFHYPLGVAVDGAGRVYVADSGNDRIQVFAPR